MTGEIIFYGTLHSKDCWKKSRTKDREETRLMIINCNAPLSNNVVKVGLLRGVIFKLNTTQQNARVPV